MSVKRFLSVSLLLTALVIGSVLYHSGDAKGLELNSYVYKAPINSPQGSMKYELTFENAVNKFSTNIVIGRVSNISEYDKNHDMVTVEVEEELLGKVDQNRIEIYASNYSLETNERYMLFLTEHDSTLYPNEFYVLLNQFVMKIDDADNLLILEDPVKKIFVAPFKDTKYNKLSDTKEYIEKIKDDNIFKNKPKKKVIDKIHDINEQIELSDHIFELTATDIAFANSAKTIVTVELITDKIYKGCKFENIHSILLPASIEEGKTYLIFLQSNEESVSLTARQGSIIEVGTLEYEEVLSILEKQ